MRTTIDLPDDLFRQAKARAALDGTTFKELVARFVEQGLHANVRRTLERTRRRSEPPVARAATGRSLPVFSHAELHRILDDE